MNWWKTYLYYVNPCTGLEAEDLYNTSSCHSELVEHA
jgi:hypothetical protein